MSYQLRMRQAREAAARFGRAVARGNCHQARKHKSAYIKAVSLLRDVLPGRYSQKFENAHARMDDKLERCYIRTGQQPAGR